ncbi:MAG: hypothetical protein ACTSYG_07550 [Candidatus Heimdallarchaeota archaeon]
MIKLSGFIFAILAVAFIISSFAVIMADVASTSNDNIGITNFSGYDKVENIREKSDNIKSSITNISSEKTGFDIVGRIFGSGVDTVQLTYSSLELGLDMADDSFGGINNSNGIPTGNVGSLFSTFLITGFIILIAITIVLAIILRWQT